MPAPDALLVEYARHGRDRADDARRLSDYLGWKNTFGTAKIRSASAPMPPARRRHGLHTAGRHQRPQALQRRGQGKDRARHLGDAGELRSDPQPVSIQIERNDVVIEEGQPDEHCCDTDQKSTNPVHATVSLAVVQPQAEVEVRKGKTAPQAHLRQRSARPDLGRRLRRPAADHPARQTRVLGASGRTLAWIVQDSSSGPILGAAMLPPSTNWRRS